MAGRAALARRKEQQARHLGSSALQGRRLRSRGWRVRAFWRACPRPERAAVDRDGRRRDSRLMRKRVDRHGMLGPYGVRYSWVYWAAAVAGFTFLIVDFFDDGAIWNYAVIVTVIIGIAVRPGGIRGPRAAAADEPAPRAT